MCIPSGNYTTALLSVGYNVAMSAPSPDPHALVLCQTPGLDAILVERLLVRWGDAATVLMASSSALRSEGIAPVVVARLVAAQRQVASIAAGLKGLSRLGITPIPLPSPDYPQRLREQSNAPLVIYVQGAWPPSAPAVALLVAAEQTEAALALARPWLAQLRSYGVALAGSGAALKHVPDEITLAVVPFGLLLARQRLPAALIAAAQKGTLTLVSPTAVNQPPDTQTTALAEATLHAFVVAQLLLDPLVAPLVSTLPTWWLTLPESNLPLANNTLRRLRPTEAGGRRLAKSLGIHMMANTTVQQERLL